MGRARHQWKSHDGTAMSSPLVALQGLWRLHSRMRMSSRKRAPQLVHTQTRALMMLLYPYCISRIRISLVASIAMLYQHACPIRTDFVQFLPVLEPMNAGFM